MEVAPGRALYVPAGHGRQLREKEVGEYVPAGHCVVHVAAPAGLTVPGGQEPHASDDVELLSGLYVLAAHGVHAESFHLFKYVPGGQPMQTVDPTAGVCDPNGHAVHVSFTWQND